MRVKDLIEKFSNKFDYEINIDYCDEFEVDIDDEYKTISLFPLDEDEDIDDEYDTEECEFDGNCEDCENETTCRINPDNSWRYSEYENKDIGDWDVDDHLAAWFDHQMEK